MARIAAVDLVRIIGRNLLRERWRIPPKWLCSHQEHQLEQASSCGGKPVPHLISIRLRQGRIVECSASLVGDNDGVNSRLSLHGRTEDDG